MIAAWSDRDLVAQAVLFFVAGFETVSVGMCLLLYELAINPSIQNRLAKEIKEHDTKNRGKFDFTSVQEMTYLDMVISGNVLLFIFFQSIVLVLMALVKYFSFIFYQYLVIVYFLSSTITVLRKKKNATI